MRGTKPRSKSYFKVLFSFVFTIFSYSYKRKFLLSKRSLKSIFSKNAVLKKIPKIYLFENYIRCYENEEMFWLERMFSIVLFSSSFFSFFTFLGFFWLLLCFRLLFSQSYFKMNWMKKLNLISVAAQMEKDVKVIKRYPS